MREHTLKTDPEVYDAMERGDKTHEIRFNDRDYQPGDLLVLQRTQHSGQAMRDGAPLVYTPGKELRRVVTHVLEGYGLQPGWCILSVRPEALAAPGAPEEHHCTGWACAMFKGGQCACEVAAPICEQHGECFGGKCIYELAPAPVAPEHTDHTPGYYDRNCPVCTGTRC